MTLAFFFSLNLTIIMRIPHIVPKNTIQAYTPSTQTTSLLSECLRKLISENFEWDQTHCPSLEDFCIQTLAKHFQEKPILDELPCFDSVHLLDILPLDLPLEFIIPLVDDEHYWKRRYMDNFKYTWRTKPKGWTWKSQYLERHCQKLVEEAQPQYGDEETFDEVLSLCNPYVTRLFVEQLQCWKPPLTMEKDDIPEVWPVDHINMGPIFKKLNNLQEFDLIFGMKIVGEDFKWDMFKVTVADCQKLGKALQDLQNLRILRIHRSNLDYEHCQALVQGLLKCPHLDELDLSHCHVMDMGALCIAHLLNEGSELKVLNLTNNEIGKIGSEGIGFALLSGKCEDLRELNLRLNPLGTQGAMGIMRALVRCSIPKKLSLAACMFGEDTPLKICQMLKLNETLKYLDVSSNWFGEEIGKVLVEAVRLNTCLEWLDFRETGVSDEQDKEIREYLLRNRKAAIAEARIDRYEHSDEIFEESSFTFP